MSATKLVTTVAVSLLLGGAHVPSASATNACVFDSHKPVSVAPYKVDVGIDWGSYSANGGAQLFVPARDGLTREWLAASVQHALSSAQVVSSADGARPEASCDIPQLKNVHVSVVSGGNGFWVQLIGNDAKTNDLLLKWAKEFVAVRNSKAVSTAAR
jgi:hypothetical protein